MSWDKNKPKGYLPLHVFERGQDWSSRVIHDMHRHRRPYKADALPEQMTFGTVPVGSMSAAQTGIVRNDGYRPLRIHAVVSVGSYLVTHNAPTELMPGESFEMSVIFKPDHGGLSSGGVYIDTGNAAGKEFIKFIGFGSGVAPDPDPDPEVLPRLSISDGLLEDYGDVDVPVYISIGDGVLETVSEEPGEPLLRVTPSSLTFSNADLNVLHTQLLTFENIGEEDLQLTAITWNLDLVTPEGPFGGGPFDREYWDFNTIIQPGNSATLAFGYFPTVEGLSTCSITIKSNSSGGDVVVSLIGSTEEVTPGGFTYLSAVGSDLFDEDMNQVILKAFNWYGFAGILMPGGLWAAPYKSVTVDNVTHVGILDHMADAGFNAMRLPICEDITWPNRKIIGTNTINARLNPDFLAVPLEPGSTVGNSSNLIDSILILDKVIEHCGALGIRVILDMHCLAPNTDNAAGTLGKWYTTSTPGAAGGTTGNSGEPRNEEQWIQAWEFLAERYKDNPVVCGFDLINEPHNCTWDDDPLTGLPAALERCAERVHAINPDVLILCAGVAGNVIFPLGEEWGTIWGGNLTGVRSRPIQITHQNKVVYTPHEYANMGAGSGPNWLYDSRFPGFMPEYIWDELWGYIAKEGIAPLFIGEFGGNFNSGQTMQLQWINEFSNYMATTKQSWAYWSANASGNNNDGLQGLIAAGWESGVNTTTLNALQNLLSVSP